MLSEAEASTKARRRMRHAHRPWHIPRRALVDPSASLRVKRRHRRALVDPSASLRVTTAGRHGEVVAVRRELSR
jgi:hypothetical protein